MRSHAGNQNIAGKSDNKKATLSHQRTNHRSVNHALVSCSQGWDAGGNEGKRCCVSCQQAGGDQHIVFRPDYSLRTTPILRAAGKQIQAKYANGSSSDGYEQEADRIADTINEYESLHGGSPPVLSWPTHRSCEGCAEDAVQRKNDMHVSESSMVWLAGKLQPRTPGLPLSVAERLFFESRLGFDFSDIRIHADEQADSMAQSINAHAYTLRNNIVFARNQYNFNSRSGKQLLAHELVHTIQQSNRHIYNGVPGVQRNGFEPWPEQLGEDVPDTREREGDIIREQVQRGGDPTYDPLGPALLEFNTSTCRLTIRKEINFIRAGSGAQQLSEQAFTALKQRILNIARERLNGWVNIRMEPNEQCDLSCPGNLIGVEVVTTEGTGSYSSTVNLHPQFGRENAGNIGADASEQTIWHELGHIVLGAADEYYEEQRPDNTPRPRERVNEDDWSVMAGDANARRVMLHPRHFSHLPTWLHRRFPRCSFQVDVSARPQVVEITPVLTEGALISAEGNAFHFATGVDFGIPLDRLRRLELTLGPRINLLASSDQLSLLLGFRAGLEVQPATTGLRAGAFVEAGGAGITNLRTGELGVAPYLEGGVSADYSIGGTINVGAEAAVGHRRIPAGDGSTDREWNQYYRLGLRLGLSF